MAGRVFLISGIALSILVVAYLATIVSFADIKTLLVQIDKSWLLVFLICSLTMSIGHVWRYNLLLSANEVRINPLILYLIVLVRNMGSDLLPARIGTAVYILLANRGLKIPLDKVTSSFGYALLFDYLVMAPLVVGLALIALSGNDSNWLAIMLFGLALTAIFALITFNTHRIAQYLTRLPAKGRVKDFLLKLELAVAQVNGARILGRVLLLTLVIRVFKYAGLYSVLMALLSSNPAAQMLSPLKALIGIYAAEVSASLPISGPAGIGTYQGVWLATFKLLGLPENLAAATGVSHHLLTQFYGYSLGIFALLSFLFIMKLTKRSFVSQATPGTRIGFLGGYALIVLVPLLLGWSLKN
jgi:uncharacterized membrane protein YbhN (UPF0104 family)